MSLLLAMALFSLVFSISPGPVNMIILSSGVNYGMKRTMPYVSGATIGFTLLLIAIGLGFYQIIKTYPDFLTVLSVAGAAYIVYVGIKIAMSKPDLAINQEAIPKFYEGFLLQWLNPKAWIACVSGVSLFASAESALPLLTFSSIYFVVCYVSLAIWAMTGSSIAFLLNNSLRRQLFNLTMAASLIIPGLYLGYSHFFKMI